MRTSILVPQFKLHKPNNLLESNITLKKLCFNKTLATLRAYADDNSKNISILWLQFILLMHN